MKNPNPCLIEENELALFADYYEFTGGKADLDHDNQNIITENYFVRKIPKHLGSYLVSAGLEQVASFIKNFKLAREGREWLKNSSGKDLSDKFLDYLENFEFKGDVYAVPEGTVMFPNEPMINVTGRSIDVQIFETYLLNTMNFQTRVATKASRVVNAAKGRTVLEFGARRADSRDAAVTGARAAYIGGVAGTSLVLAGKKLGIPYAGTMPHKFVQERESELQAFREYAESFQHNTILLIDTYDTIQGAKNACAVGKELREKGYDLKGVRLDSGDLATLSKNVRKILDSEGFYQTKIFASNDLDEFSVEDLVYRNAPIEGFGVGTRLITGANYNSKTKEGGVSALGGVYKLVETISNGISIPKIKISEDIEKTILPGRKQVYRKFDNEKFAGDTIVLWDENPEDDWKPLLIPIILNGEMAYDFPPLKDVREYRAHQISSLPKNYKWLAGADAYPVQVSEELKRLQQDMINTYRVGNPCVR